MDIKAVIKQTNMQNVDQTNAIQIARQATEKFAISKDIEKYIKDRFDTEYGHIWECSVGKNIGVFDGTTQFILFDLGQVEFLIFKHP